MKGELYRCPASPFLCLSLAAPCWAVLFVRHGLAAKAEHPDHETRWLLGDEL
jgi:hypothetical protein